MQGIDDTGLKKYIIIKQCMKCSHYDFDSIPNHTCDAFPDGIPDDIIYGYVDHTKPHKGDHSIQYEPIT